MPTKRELLEEKTVKELKQMAKDEDLSGYSTKRKSGLIDMIEKNYTKSEIESWPWVERKARPKEVELGELELEGKLAEWPPSAEAAGETGEATGKARDEEEALKRIIIGTIIGLILVMIIIVVFYILWR